MSIGGASRRAVLGGVAATAVLGRDAAARSRATDRAWAMAADIRRRIRPPRFASGRVFTPQQFGGVPDGRTLATAAIAAAVAAASRTPGGARVLVDGGIWLTGPVHLRSGVELHVARGSTLRFATDPALYFPPVLTRIEGNELMGISPLIYALDADNIAITGGGTLDGQADAAHWWDWKPLDMTPGASQSEVRRMAEEGVAVSRRVFGPGSTVRPQFIQPYRCRNVLIEGVTIIRSPMWEVHPVECENVTVRRITVRSHGPNNDGCDPESCRDVLIEDCLFDTGDDCIAIKSGRNADGRRLARPAENIVIAGCTMADGHGGVTLGSEISGGVRNVFIERCRMNSPNLNTALRFKNNAARGGTLTNIHVRDVEVGQVAHAAVTIDYNYGEGARGAFRPVFEGLTIEGLRVGSCERVLDLQGFATAPIRGVTLRNCLVMQAAQPDIVVHVDDLRYDNVRRNGLPVRRPTPGGVPRPAARDG